MKIRTWSWGKPGIPDIAQDKMICEKCSSSLHYYKWVSSRRLGAPALCTRCFLKQKRSTKLTKIKEK